MQAPVDAPEISALSQIRRNRIAAANMDLMFKEIFTWRTVQTDPHFGNFKIRLGSDREIDKIVLLDFGAVRKFPKRYIKPFSELVEAALNRDEEALWNAGHLLGFLREDDAPDSLKVFSKLCFAATEGFEEKYVSPKQDGSDEGSSPYVWGSTDIIERLTLLARDAVFAFRLRPPPREAIFLDRKMVGTYFLLSQLGLRMGPRHLLKSYLDESTSDD